MPFIGWLLIGSGVYFVTVAVQNRPPKDTFIAIVTGKALPLALWHPLPGLPPRGIGGGPVGNPGSGLPAGNRATVIAFGKAQLGERYVFGASGPNVWDCSGLTQQAYKQVGIKLPHHAASQQRMGVRVTESNAKPGDLVFWGVVASHVGIYLGDGKVLHAPKTGDVVKISSIWDKNRVTYRSYISDSPVVSV